MVRTTLLVARGGKLIVCMIYRPPGQNTAAGARAPERMTSGGPVLYVCVFVVHTGSSSRTGGGERGRNMGRRRKGHRGKAQKRPACLPACLPAYRPGDFCSHARTHCSRPAYISVRFPSHEISRGWAHGASWLSTKDAGPRRQMRWMTGPSSSFSVTTFFSLSTHIPLHRHSSKHGSTGGGWVWVTCRD